jgi:hypothetical protein
MSEEQPSVGYDIARAASILGIEIPDEDVAPLELALARLGVAALPLLYSSSSMEPAAGAFDPRW